MTRNRPLARHAAKLAAAAVMVGAAALPATAQDVGQVSLLIGEAHVVRGDGSKGALHRGDAIRVGDRVETAANGHVHMRFIDNAAVSVRPDSSLEVQAYTYDPQKPSSNEIRLRVEKGTSRSISGAATEVDKNRFRLNTPIAAIGVRGTDFIVQTDPTGVRATVSDGAIVVGALGGACSTSGLGPCGGTEVRELSAEMGRLMAEVRAGEQLTRIVPASDVTTASAAGRTGRGEGNGRSGQGTALAQGSASTEPMQIEVLSASNRAAAELLTLASMNMPDPNRPSDVSNQLIWGRWAISPEETDKLSVPFALARLGRHVTVSDQQMSLFRMDQTSPGEMFGSLLGGSAEFHLSRASATYAVGTQSEQAAVTASNLTIDFSRRQFLTALDLTSASGIKGELRMGGSIRNDGIFTVKDGEQQYISGAISLDGKEAGYLFDRKAGSGSFHGRTLWGR